MTEAVDEVVPGKFLGEKLPNITAYKGKLIIATNFYNQHSLSRYTRSMVDTAVALERTGVNWEFWPVHGDFHIERAVNTACSRFLDDEEATDLLIIDSDECWDVVGVFRLLSCQEDVVSGAYRMKNNWEQYTCKLRYVDGKMQGKVLPDGTALISAERITAGFMRLRKPPLWKYIEAYPEHSMDGGNKIYNFFHTAIRDGTFFSQDFNFSEKLRALGIPLWVDPNIDISHFGVAEYPGNLDKHLKRQKDDRKAQEAFAAVKQMAEEILAR